MISPAIALFLCIGLNNSSTQPQAVTVKIGSKIFTESYILAEIAAQTLEKLPNVKIERKFGLGGTGIAYESLKSGDIDLYPEYTGTISETILKDPKISETDEIKKALQNFKLLMSDSLGFNNTYGIGVRELVAERLNLKTISDLFAKGQDLRASFSSEFMVRPDGYPGLSSRYGARLSNIKSMEHSLAYQAIADRVSDLTDVYTTDAKIQSLRLRVLEDDKKFFPVYLAVFLARQDFAEKRPDLWKALQSLAGRIDAPTMISLNSKMEISKKTASEVAAGFLKTPALSRVRSMYLRIKLASEQHLVLVMIALLFSVLFGMPMGILCARKPFFGKSLLLLSSLLQTIPSLALLCFMIPLFGIGTLPALVALFLYGLFPIILGVYTGLSGVDSKTREMARALGLTRFQILTQIEMPLASRSILAGIETSAIISIGTATLAALIGAGGYGVAIIRGLTLNDRWVMLEGAIPAAVLAILVYILFGFVNRILVPKGIRHSLFGKL